MHGKMHTPRYHGRIYPGWELQALQNSSNLDARFNSVHEDRIEESLKVLLSRQKSTIYPDPNESTLLTVPLSTSTLRILASGSATMQEKLPTETSVVSNTSRFRAHSPFCNDRESIPSLTDSTSTITAPPPSSQQPPSTTPLLQATPHPISTVTSQIHTTSPVEIFIEPLTTNPVTAYTIEWLYAHDTQHILDRDEIKL